MVKVRHKSEFKKKLREVQPPNSRPYEPPRAVPQSFSTPEEVCKELAANDETIRDQALLDIGSLMKGIERQYKGSGDLDALSVEFLKLWKGLFYCMWHSDKPLVQLECADRIAGLVRQFTDRKVQQEWMRQGWKTMDRHWPMLDKWRIDKYYSLMRRMLNAQLDVLSLSQSELSGKEADEVFAVFAESMNEMYESLRTGIGCHISDCLLDECIAVKFPPRLFLPIMCGVVLPVLSRTHSKLQRERLHERVWVRILGGIKETSEEALLWIAELPWEDIRDEVEKVAVAPETHHGNRPLLNSMMDEINDFMEKVELVAMEEDLVEIDSDTERKEIRAEVRRREEKERREHAESNVAKLQEVKKQRLVRRRMAKAVKVGDEDGVKAVLRKAKQAGVKVVQKKRKKGKGNLKGTLGVADDKQALAKQQKVYRRKRRK